MHLHILGICGTFMGSLALLARELGHTVTGSDQNVYPPMSTFLAERGIPVISGYAEQNLASKPDLVVIGNAISRGNPEAEYALDHKLRYCSLPELLKEFFIRGKRSLAAPRPLPASPVDSDRDCRAGAADCRVERGEPAPRADGGT